MSMSSYLQEDSNCQSEARQHQQQQQQEDDETNISPHMNPKTPQKFASRNFELLSCIPNSFNNNNSSLLYVHRKQKPQIYDLKTNLSKFIHQHYKLFSISELQTSNGFTAVEVAASLRSTRGGEAAGLALEKIKENEQVIKVR